MQYDKWSIVKIINLQYIGTDLSFNVKKYSEFSQMLHPSKSYADEFRSLKIQVEYIKNETLEKLQQLIPSKRFKRGIVNPLGSIIKIITGNLDHEDAVRYDNIISSIQTEEQAISNKFTMISKMLDHFLNSTEIINENTKIIDARIKLLEGLVTDLTKKDNHSIYMTYVFGLLNQFIVNFRTLYMKLSELETAIAFSKLSVLHKAVMNPSELLKVLKYISQYDNLMYPVNERNLINIEESLSVKAYIKNEELTFVIEVPLIYNATYSYYKLYSIPISDDSSNLTFAVIPEFPYLLVEGSRYRPTDQPCQEITAKEYLCSEDKLIQYGEETCIEQLMKYHDNLSRCFPRKILSESLKLQRIGPNSWIVYSKHNQVISQTCNNDETKERIRGTYLLTVRGQCDVSIDNIQIHGRRTYSLQTDYMPVPLLNLPDLIDLTRDAARTEPINLKGVNLDDIRQLNNILKNSANTVKSETTSESVSVALYVLYAVVILLSVAVIIYKYLDVVRKFCKERDRVIEDNPAQPEDGQVNQRPILLV